MKDYISNWDELNCENDDRELRLQKQISPMRGDKKD